MPLPEPVFPETPSPSHHPHILPATPRSSLRPTILQHSAQLHKRSVPLQEGHLLLPHLLRLSPLTALASRGWGPQSWTHPTVAPHLSQQDRLTVGRRTPEPCGGQCARVPRSLFKVSASWVCSPSGALETCGSRPRALTQTTSPKVGFTPGAPEPSAGQRAPWVHSQHRSRGPSGGAPG